MLIRLFKMSYKCIKAAPESLHISGGSFIGWILCPIRKGIYFCIYRSYFIWLSITSFHLVRLYKIYKMNYAYAPCTLTEPAWAWMNRRATRPSVGVVVSAGAFVTTQTN